VVIASPRPAPSGRQTGPSRSAERRIRSYDFTVSEALDRNELRAVRTATESFARRVGRLLSGRLRVAVRLEVGELEQRAWVDVANELSDPAYVGMVALAPLPGRVVVHIPLELAGALVDLSLGGRGEPGDPQRPLSEIEQGIVSRLALELLGELGGMIGPGLALSPQSLGDLASPILVPTSSESLVVLVLPLQVELATRPADTLTLALPFGLVRLVLQALSHDASEDRRDQAEGALAARLLDVPLEARVQFNSTRLPSAVVEQLAPGDILRLPHAPDQPLELVVDDHRWALVAPATEGRRLVCTILERTEASR